MSIRASISSPDLQTQIEVLKYFPRITAKYYRPALKTATAALASVIRPKIPRLTGRAQSTFGTKVTGRSIKRLQGRVGWFDKDDPWTINIVEYGARSHPLQKGSRTRSRAARARFAEYKAASESLGMGNKGGVHIYIQRVGWRTMSIHPGFSARGFMAAGYAAATPIVEREMSAAGEKVVAELAAI